jgi:hypothetical protein
MNAEDRWQRLIADPATPDWVKAVLDLVVRLDPVDAANWMEVIADVTARRADEALAAGLAVDRGRSGGRSGYRRSCGGFCEGARGQ